MQKQACQAGQAALKERHADGVARKRAGAGRMK